MANITGTANNDILNAVDSFNTITGLAGDDTLTGNSAANTLDGGTGADTMLGGGGDDIYIVDDANDVVQEPDAITTLMAVDTPTNGQITGYTESPVKGISADGSKVLFSSGAFGSTGNPDVYLKDLDSGALTCVSVGSNGVAGDGYSFAEALSADGVQAIFSSDSTNLVANDSNGLSDIFVRNMQTGKLSLVNVSVSGVQANGLSRFVALSADGNQVLFTSAADNLVAGDTDGMVNFFLKNLKTGAITRINGNNANTLAMLSHYSGHGSAEFMEDGTKALYASEQGLSLIDLNTGAVSSLATNPPAPGFVSLRRIRPSEVLSADSSRSLYWNGNGVFVKNLNTGEVIQVNTSRTGELDNGSTASYEFNPVLSPDGNQVLFVSNGSNLVSGDTNGKYDLFLKNLLSGEIVRVNTTVNGEQGSTLFDIPSFSAMFTPDGRIIFENEASNLVANDDSFWRNIFIKDYQADGGGKDTVKASISYTLGQHIENLVLTGTEAINGVGNNKANKLTGNSAANVLNGGLGKDTMAGGAGNDTYIVDNPGDVVSESSTLATEIDTVLSSINYTLRANVENLVLTGYGMINGSGNSLNNVLTGNSSVNVLNGGAGKDTMVGGAGNDTYMVDNTDDIVVELSALATEVDTVLASASYALSANVEKLLLTGTAAINGTGNALANTLTGNSAANVLSGGDGADMLNGGAGADTLFGGVGDDRYWVDNSLDVVTEAAGSGVDQVCSSVSFTLSANLERLVLAGTQALNGSGNALDNVLSGNASTNILSGGQGNDQLYGFDGADILNGNAGADTLNGGRGNDQYFVDDLGDIVQEVAGFGRDSVSASVSYTLTANVENLLLTGTAANGAGNSLDNFITGNAVANILSGAVGADTLVGGAGNDRYDFGRGYGADTVVENDTATGNLDVLKVLSGVAHNQLWFSHAGNNLEVSIIGASDKIIVQNWYLGAARHVERIETVAGNKTLLDTNVENLVTAMASMTPPPLGQTVLTAAQHAQLDAVIAANWS